MSCRLTSTTSQKFRFCRFESLALSRSSIRRLSKCRTNGQSERREIMGKLTNKVAVVTGSSKGIGAGIARSLAAEGAAVVVNYASSKEGAERVVSEIKAKGGKAIAVHGDVAKAKDVQRLFAETKKAFGRLDVLVNNAGVYEFAPLEQVTEGQFHHMFDTNVLGLILATQEAAKHFGADGGSVINIGSVASSLTAPTTSVYTATKGAVGAGLAGEGVVGGGDGCVGGGRGG